MVSRRNFLKLGAGTAASTAKKTVSNAVNPVKKIAKAVSDVQDVKAAVQAVPTGKQTRRRFLSNTGELGKRVALKKKVPQKIGKYIMENSDPTNVALKPYKPNKIVNALRAVGFSTYDYICTFKN